MVLKRKGFFLNLEEGTSTELAIQIAPVRDLPVDDGQEESLAPIPAIIKLAEGGSATSSVAPSPAVTKQSVAAAPATASTSDSAKPKTQPSSSAGSLTTAEAIAAELAAAEAARPEVTFITFAPELLRPGRAVRQNPRRPGRNLKGFRTMASELFSS